MPPPGRPRYTKPDANHAEIRDECRALGMIAWDLKDLGGKIPDLLIICRLWSLSRDLAMAEEGAVVRTPMDSN